MQTPLLTSHLLESLMSARRAGLTTYQCSLDLQRSTSLVELHAEHWCWLHAQYPYPGNLKPRTIYFWDGKAFQPASRYGTALIKLVPTEWGAPTFEIDGIKMLPTSQTSPYTDAERKVALIQPRGKVILDCCGGLGYFAASCLKGGAQRILSFEKNPDVLWLRSLNPWSPEPDAILSMAQGDISEAVLQIPSESVEAVLHDPPRFGMAGELYSQAFYDQLNRVLRQRGRLFHYTGTPNKVSRGRDLAGEVSLRLRSAGFEAKRVGDGILATKRGPAASSVPKPTA